VWITTDNENNKNDDGRGSVSYNGSTVTLSLIDGAYTIPDREAIAVIRELLLKEGVLYEIVSYSETVVIVVPDVIYIFRGLIGHRNVFFFPWRKSDDLFTPDEDFHQIGH